jgi:hypothetical protein
MAHWNLYVITCVAPGPNRGKQYVGITRSNPFQRFGQHLDTALYKKSSAPLYLAMREYGSEGFTIEHLACSRSKADALISEVSIITELQSRFPSGFNVAGRGFPLNPEHVERCGNTICGPKSKGGIDKTCGDTGRRRTALHTRRRSESERPTLRIGQRTKLNLISPEIYAGEGRDREIIGKGLTSSIIGRRSCSKWHNLDRNW